MIAGLAATAATLAAVTGGPVDPGGPLPAPEGGWEERRIEWALAGVGPGARSIVVQPGWWGGCDQGPPRVRVTERADRIEVEAVIREPVNVAAMVCPAIARMSRPQRIELSSPVDGRRIMGPEHSTRPAAAFAARPDQRRRIPRVIGLRAADARRTLCGWLVRARGARGDAVVTGQSRRPGIALPPPRAIPDRCADLPRRPAVRLQGR